MYMQCSCHVSERGGRDQRAIGTEEVHVHVHAVFSPELCSTCIGGCAPTCISQQIVSFNF